MPLAPADSAFPWARGVVLHVEDDYESRRATGLVLKQAGFDAREAESADAAIAQAESLRNVLDVLIVDFHLGGEITGTEVAESLARLLGHGVPTIILTGDPANAEIPWLRNSPVWLARKPVSPAILIAGIDPLVAFRRAMKRLPPT
jgi:DNA-binding response OmpR family regulator